MKVLFIGGNGNISWWCVQEALNKGYEVWELNRSATLSTRREIQSEVHKLTGDMRNPQEIKELIKDLEFDVVCDFICFNPEHAQTNIKLFRNKTKQFIFISSESIYKRKSEYLPFKESCEQVNPEESSPYIAGKILCERVFKEAYEKEGFPLTIVRPGYTYDTIVPVSIGHNCFSAPQRFINGQPVLISGDGTNLWTFTNSRDFASAFVELIGNKNAVGEDFHITSDEWLSWNEQSEILLDVLNVKEKKYIHVPYQDALGFDFFQAKDLIKIKMWHSIFDNSKIKKIAPKWSAKIKLKDGLKTTMDWLFEEDVRRRITPDVEKIFDILYEKYPNNVKGEIL